MIPSCDGNAIFVASSTALSWLVKFRTLAPNKDVAVSRRNFSRSAE
jgi:hypothetical protein